MISKIKAFSAIFPLLIFAFAGCDGSKMGDGQDGETQDEPDISTDESIDPAAEDGMELPPDFPADTGGDEETEGDIIEDPESDGPDMRDSDNDTIRDVDEGDGSVDTDRDGTPDSLDIDSDNDTIPDSVEAGDDDPLSGPVDTESDGIPDFRDNDSDGDTILDTLEGSEDIDGDGIPNYRDLDCDGDFLSDSFEAGDDNLSTPPVDSDMDGIPNYLDTDSDNDNISDADESVEDTDGDGILDFIDRDSDNDGIQDIDEAGDEFLLTEPVNCDDDHLPNYRDTDSDNDGIPDGLEESLGTEICDADSDDDGITDLIETAYGSDPLDPDDHPRARGDFVFVVPYEENPDPDIDTIVFSTDIQMADVFFTIDTSGTMGGEIFYLTQDLQDVIIPGIQDSIPDSRFGVGRFEDCPDNQICANAMKNLQDITSSAEAVQAALDSITSTCGGSEPYTSTLWVIATGDTSPWSSYSPSYFSPHPRRCSDPATIGWPCFRPGAIPIIIQFGDELFSEDESCALHRSAAEAIDALNSIKAKYIGVNSGVSHADMAVIAGGTNSVDVGGDPLVFDINPDGTGLGEEVASAVATLATQVPIDVNAVAEDNTSDAVDATIFIDRIEPNNIGGITDPVDPTKTCVGGLTVEDTDGDTHPDVFMDIIPGTTVCFDIYPAMNTTEPPDRIPQLYGAFIHVFGDGFTILDTRNVFFLVPPEIPGGN